MNSNNQIILIGIIITIFLSIFFFNIQNDRQNEYIKTDAKLDGLKKINNLNNLKLTLQNKRGISQLKNTDSISSKTLISDKNLINSLEKLNLNDEINILNQIIEEIDILSKVTLFNKYTKIIKSLDDITITTAYNSNLLFESQSDINILVTTFIFNVSAAIEDIGQLRAIGTKILSNKNHERKDLYIIKSSINDFLKNIEKIKFLTKNLPLEERNNFTFLINETISSYLSTNNIIRNIMKNKYIISSEKYFLKTTMIFEDINTIFKLSNDIINQKLNKRKDTLRSDLIFYTILYILLVILIFASIYFISRKVSIDRKIQFKQKEKENFINILRSDYSKIFTLKKICDSSLLHLIEKFNAINGSLYLYNEVNSKLYLASTYGIKYDELEDTLELNQNRISQNILEKKINILHIDTDTDIGNTNIKCTKYITIPLLEFDQSIGTIQLSFDNNFKNIDLDFLQQSASLMATYINKASFEDESSKYLNLIDQNILMSKTDLDGNIIEVSESLCSLTQYSKEELIGQSHSILQHEDTTQDHLDNIWNVLSQGETWKGESKNRRKDGSFYWLDSIITPDRDINENIIGYTAIRHNITDRKHIEQIAITDGLTSLHNRRHFDDVFPQQIKIAKREKSFLCFVLMDIDHFKQYNDTYGHQEGDTTLKLVAKALKDTLKRPTDFTFRLGGEEFGLLYHLTNINDAVTIANEARIS
ncbi:MAG: hypothetical protein DRG78_19835, partial [Epsilonproteobacteria bacterium]